MSEWSLDPFVVAVIAAMAVATYVTKAGGLWLLGRIEVSERLERGLEVLPGAIVVAILAPEILEDGPREWAGAAVVLVVTAKSGNVFLGLVGGVGTVLLLRSFG